MVVKRLILQGLSESTAGRRHPPRADLPIYCRSLPSGQLCEGGLDRLIDLGRALCLHAVQDVGIEVEGDRNAGMSKSFADDLRVNPGPEGMRGVGVAQIVEAH